MDSRPQRHALLDFEPATGKEMGNKRPALVVTSAGYNQTGLMMVCPISASIRGAAIEVPIEGLDRPSVVVASQVHTMDWRERKVSKIGVVDSGIFEQVIQRIVPLIGRRPDLDGRKLHEGQNLKRLSWFVTIDITDWFSKSKLYSGPRI